MLLMDAMFLMDAVFLARILSSRASRADERSDSTGASAVQIQIRRPDKTVSLWPNALIRPGVVRALD